MQAFLKMVSWLKNVEHRKKELKGDTVENNFHDEIFVQSKDIKLTILNAFKIPTYGLKTQQFFPNRFKLVSAFVTVSDISHPLRPILWSKTTLEHFVVRMHLKFRLRFATSQNFNRKLGYFSTTSCSGVFLLRRKCLS